MGVGSYKDLKIRMGMEEFGGVIGCTMHIDYRLIFRLG